jgi:hypothetical protein
MIHEKVMPADSRCPVAAMVILVGAFYSYLL